MGELPTVDTRIHKWELESTERQVRSADLAFLAPFLDTVAWLENSSKFYFVGGGFVGEDLDLEALALVPSPKPIRVALVPLGRRSGDAKRGG